MHNARSVEGERQPAEIGVKEFGALFEQAHGDEEISIGKKRTPEPRHGSRIQCRNYDYQIRAADLKDGGPRYLLGLKGVSA